MSPTPLTAAQVATVQRLVTAGRLRVVPADPQRAAGFLAVADERLADVIGEACLAAYGFATVNGPGQHAAISDFLVALIDAPPTDAEAARRYDRARRARNQQNYRATPVGAAQAADVESIARALRAVAATRGVGT